MFKKLFFAAACSALSLVSQAQHVQVSDINFGSGNIVAESSGTGSPTGSCTGISRYTQTNDTSGNPVWWCVSGTWKHLPGNLTIGTVTTGAAGSSPSASLSVNGNQLALNLTIPSGAVFPTSTNTGYALVATNNGSPTTYTAQAVANSVDGRTGTVTGLADLTSSTPQAFTGNVTAPEIVAGGLAGNVSTITGATTLPSTGTNIVYRANASSGAFTVTLPTTPSYSGQIYFIKKTDSSANAVTISGSSIDGGLTYTLTKQYQQVGLIWDASSSTWNIISSATSLFMSQLQTSGLIGLYLFDATDYAGGTGTTLYDHSGNGNNCTIPTGTGAPTWVIENGAYALAWPAYSTSIQDVSCPGITAPVTVQAVATLPFGTRTNQTVFGYSAINGTTSFDLGASNFGTSPNVYYMGTAGGGSSYTGPGNGYDLYTLQAGSPGSFWKNTTLGLWVNFNPSIASGGAGNLELGGSHDYVCGSGYSCYLFNGRMYFAAVYSSAINQSGVTENYQAINQYLTGKGIPLGQQQNPKSTTAIPNVVTCTGTSIDIGTGGGTLPCNTMSLGANYSVYNVGIYNSSMVGHVLSGMNVEGGFVIPNSQNTLIMGSFPTNDFCSGTNYNTVGLSQLEGYYAQGITQAKALGYKYVLAGTMISRTGNVHSPYTGTCDAAKNTWNTWLRQNASILGANLLDIAAVPGLGADGAYANPTSACGGSACFYTDNVHLTVAGETAYGAVEQRVIQYINGSTSASPTIQTATTYQMLASDGFLLATPTAAATYTLPECQGLTGYDFNIVNGSATYTITMAGTNSETITGSATIAANASSAFRVILTGASTGGCYWLRYK